MEAAQAYADARERLCGLVRGASDAELAAPVPACPGWSVTDVLAHMTGMAADWLSGAVDGFGTAAWAQAHVDSRRVRAVGQLVEEWRALGPRLDAKLSDPIGEGMPVFMAEVATVALAHHEQDVRGALGAPGGRDAAACQVAMRAAVDDLVNRQAAAALAPLLLRAQGDRDWHVGGGDAAVVVAAPAFDLLRSLAGRRTEEEVRAFAWSDDPTPYVEHWLPHLHAWPAGPLHE